MRARFIQGGNPYNKLKIGLSIKDKIIRDLKSFLNRSQYTIIEDVIYGTYRKYGTYNKYNKYIFGMSGVSGMSGIITFAVKPTFSLNSMIKKILNRYNISDIWIDRDSDIEHNYHKYSIHLLNDITEKKN